MRHALIALLFLPAFAAEPARAQAPIQPPCFEPADDCIGVLVDEIGRADREILVMAYAFTHRRIADALAEAADRGVAVRMIVDRRRDVDGLMTRLPQRGVQLLTDPVDVQHNKIMIFDRRRLATGSQNYTRGSQNNAENLLIIDHAPTVDAYVDNWMRRADQARPFVRRGAD